MTKRRVLWMITIAWAVAIFCFSAQPAEHSSHVSSTLTEQLIQLLPGTQEMSFSDQKQLLEFVHVFLRKLAHFVEYMILGCLTAALCRTYDLQHYHGFLIAFCASSLYAVSDEVHQLFVPGRSCQFLDVLLDSFGVFVGIVLQRGLSGCIKIIKWKK